jgi:hypothetical protein
MNCYINDRNEYVECVCVFVCVCVCVCDVNIYTLLKERQQDARLQPNQSPRR